MEHWTYSHKNQWKNEEARFWAFRILVHWHEYIKLIWNSTFQMTGLLKTGFFWIKKKTVSFKSLKFSSHRSHFGYLLRLPSFSLHLTSCHLLRVESSNEMTLKVPLESKRAGRPQCTFTTCGFYHLRCCLLKISVSPLIYEKLINPSLPYWNKTQTELTSTSQG